MHEEHRNKKLLFVWIIIMVVLAVGSMLVGRYAISIEDIWAYFTGGTISSAAASAIGKIRMPRILSAMLVGGALAMSGASYQGVFRNPMVSPDILGASAGAGFGAAAGILLELPLVGIQLLAFVCGMVAVGFSWIIATVLGRKNNVTLVLVLSGMVISALFQAFISAMKYLADPYSKLPQITFWLMGGLSDVQMNDLFFILPPILIAGVVLFLLRWRLNVLVFGDEEALSLGVDTKKLRMAVIICSTLLTASAVSVSGQIGWVGLVIPHFCRMLVGPNYKYLIPASLVIGGSYLLLVDNIARNLLSVEIPLGILTAILGAPVFIYLLLHGKKEWF